jgi:transcriptional regulator with XRE-family HTH domain
MRVERRFSQEGLALRAGLARGYYGRIERGKANPTYDSIVKIADGLGASPADIVALAETYRTPPGATPT